DVRSATDASEGARRRIEIDDQAIRMKEIGRTRGRHMELDRSLVRQVREVFRVAQDGIDGDVLILASLARMLLRRRAAPWHGQPLDRFRIMRRDVLLKETGRGEPLRVAANRERTTRDVRHRAWRDPIVV